MRLCEYLLRTAAFRHQGVRGLPTADRRPPTADRRPPTADQRPPFQLSKMQSFEWPLNTKLRRAGCSITSPHFMPYQ
ncbi:hypothetical protein ETQ85_24270 [Zoogloea oleivorans]|uniref:Uncharacterized protein n=1 Tax=Zoogloea oleivorans TaxID=1552750 RepID=A0A6C2CBJ4_9RHOO|nr:hypothetical protein ETQ85_24270 [Zoogloea oleivorans]